MSHDSLEPGTIIKLRRDTATNWETDNPVLAVGETGWETDSRRVKLGDGTTAWVDLPYAADEAASVQAEQDRAESAEAALQTAINNEATTRGNADTALAAAIAAVEASDVELAAAIASLSKSTDGSFGLAVPTGVGLEFVITANALDDIRYNGTGL